jgi:hypothetical protein
MHFAGRRRAFCRGKTVAWAGAVWREVRRFFACGLRTKNVRGYKYAPFAGEHVAPDVPKLASSVIFALLCGEMEIRHHGIFVAFEGWASTAVCSAIKGARKRSTY